MKRRSEVSRERSRDSVFSYLLASDDTMRAEINEARREAMRSFDDEKDRDAWLELEREVREHRRWRHLGWALVFGPALVVVTYFGLSFLFETFIG